MSGIFNALTRKFCEPHSLFFEVRATRTQAFRVCCVQNWNTLAIFGDDECFGVKNQLGNGRKNYKNTYLVTKTAHEVDNGISLKIGINFCSSSWVIF